MVTIRSALLLIASCLFAFSCIGVTLLAILVVFYLAYSHPGLNSYSFGTRSHVGLVLLILLGCGGLASAAITIERYRASLIRPSGVWQDAFHVRHGLFLPVRLLAAGSTGLMG